MPHAKARTPQAMYPLIERYLQGHQTQKTFCAEHGLTSSVLNYWLAKYRRETTESAPAFLELAPPRPSTEPALLEVVYPHGVRLRLFALPEPAYLERLLRLNGAPPSRTGG